MPGASSGTTFTCPFSASLILGFPTSRRTHRARVATRDIELERHRIDEAAHEPLEVLVHSPRGHDLEVLTVVCHPDMLPGTDRVVEAVVQIPIESADRDPLISLIGRSRRIRALDTSGRRARARSWSWNLFRSKNRRYCFTLNLWSRLGF